MALLNDNYLKLKAGYLFPEIGRRVKVFCEANPEAAKRLRLLASALSFLLVDSLLAFLIRPVGRVVFLAPTEAFFVRVKIALVAGVFLSLPVFLYQLWRFVSTGLTPPERRYALWLLPPAFILFVGGALFALVAIIPVGEIGRAHV